MNRKLVASTLILLGLISMLPPSGPFRGLPSAHASSSGTVCIADPAFNGCPSTPPTFTGVLTSPPSKLVVAVNIQDSSSMTGFDISIKTNQSVLNPVMANDTGSIVPTLPGNQFVVKPVNCVNGSGSKCTSVDGLGVISFGEFSVGGLSITPTTGRLFLVTFQVNSTFAKLGATTLVDYQTGCPGTSDPPFCVDITSGSNVPVSELVQNANFKVVSSDFTVSASPSSLSILQSSSKTSTVTLTGVTGTTSFSGTISLLIINSAPGVTATFTPSTVTLPPSPGTSSVKILVGNSTIPLTYNLIIAATSSGLTHYAALSLTVQGFSMSISPFAPVLQGQNSSSSVSVRSTGFSGSVSLSPAVNPSLSKGPAVSIVPARVTVNSTSLTATASLNFNTTSSSPLGKYTVTVTGTSGNITQQVSITVTVVQPDFSLSASPSLVIVPPGTSNKTVITVTSLNTFAKNVSLAASVVNSAVSSLLTVSLNTTTVAVPKDGTAKASLTITAAGSTPQGKYPINVTGTSGLLAHSLLVNVTVLPAGFNLAANPSPLVVIVGKTNSSTITLSRVGNYNGTVTLSITSSNTLTGSVSPSSFTLNSTIVSGTATLKVTAAASAFPGTYKVTVNATGTAARTGATSPKTLDLTTYVVIPDFTISSTQPVMVLNLGGSNTTTITLKGLYFFNGTVTLTSSINSTATNIPVAAIIPATLALNKTSPNSASMLTLAALGSTASGAYLVTIKGQSGLLSHNVNILVVIPDISITPSPVYVRIILGVNLSTGDSALLVTSLRGFTGTVGLTATISPSTAGSPAPSISSSLLVKAGGSNGTVVTIQATPSTPPQNYTVTITVISGAIVRTATINVEVILPMVKITQPILSTPTGTNTITPGQIVTVYIQVANPTKVNESISVAMDINNGVGNYNLTVDHKDLNLQPDDNVTVTLEWDTTSNTPGSYKISVRIISANKIVDKSAQVSSLTLNASQATGQLPGGNTLWVAIGILAALIIIGYLVLRWRRKPSEARQTIGA